MFSNPKSYAVEFKFSTVRTLTEYFDSSPSTIRLSEYISFWEIKHSLSNLTNYSEIQNTDLNITFQRYKYYNFLKFHR